MKKPINLIFFVLICLTGTLSAQPADSLRKDRLISLIAGSAAAYSGTIIYLSNQWYSQYESQPFTFFNDAGEWKQMDKAGHAYGGYHFQRLGYAGLRWSGVPERKALLWSGITSFVFMSSIEIMDGFSTGYGASATDLVANAAGIGLFTFQQIGWGEIRIHPKFSFQRTSLAKERPDVLGNGLHEELVKDYNGQTFWLSVDIQAFTKNKFPKWLNVAVGYGANNMLFAEDESNIEAGLSPYRQFYLGPDIDLSHIRTRSKFLNTLLFAIDMIRIPVPALELSQGDVHWHWLK